MRTAIKKKPQPKLIDLIDRIDWVAIGRKGATSKLDTNALAIGYYTANKGDKEPSRIRLRIGGDIIDALGWKKGDKILANFDPNDVATFMLVKCETGAGVKLGREGPISHVHGLQFSWHKIITLPEMSMTLIEYEIHEASSCLLFRVPVDV